MLSSQKILIILVIFVIVISITNSKSPKKEPFLQQGESYCWTGLNARIPNECMGGYNYKSECTTVLSSSPTDEYVLSSPADEIVITNWNTLTPSSKIQAFMEKNNFNSFNQKCNNACIPPEGTTTPEYNWHKMNNNGIDDTWHTMNNNGIDVSNRIIPRKTRDLLSDTSNITPEITQFMIKNEIKNLPNCISLTRSEIDNINYY